MADSADLSNNYFKSSSMKPFFLPKSVAVVGAKDDPHTVGRTLMVNLKSHFKGKIYPINPKRPSVLDLPCYSKLSEIPEPVDLVIIATPAKTIPSILNECNQLSIPAAIVISAGFKEMGPEGLALEKQLLASKGKTRIIGPNCLGVMNPLIGLNATFASSMALPGNLAFISQSGAMCTAVLDWSLQQNIGFSAFVSVGSMSDVQWGDLIDYLGKDPDTDSILIYMETIGDAKSFLSVAKEVALKKPIVVIKPGRTEQAAQAAASHTGSLAGSDEVFNTAMQRVGVMRVDSIAELFNMAQILAKQPKPQGPNLAIITNAGGPAVLATDATIANGAQIAKLKSETIQELNTKLPAAWSHGNPVDILGDAPSDRYLIACEAVLKDSNTDGVLVILTPQDMTEPTETAKALLNIQQDLKKPIFASWMGGSTVNDGSSLLSRSSIPVFAYPDDAAVCFGKLWQHCQQLGFIKESSTSSPNLENLKQIKSNVDQLIEEVLSSGQTLLTETQSKKLLNYYNIPTVPTVVAQTIDEALSESEQMGFPVVLKLHSLTITHKSDIGGVKLNLKNAQEVKEAYLAIQKAAGKDFHGVAVQKMIKYKEAHELIIGSSEDAQFGPVLLFGAGGKLVEILKDRALALPPLNQKFAKSLINSTKISQALKGARGEKSIDFEILEKILVNFSIMITQHPRIKECDINPLIASSEGIIALDARIILHPNSVKDEDLPHSSYDLN